MHSAGGQPRCLRDDHAFFCSSERRVYLPHGEAFVDVDARIRQLASVMRNRANHQTIVSVAGSLSVLHYATGLNVSEVPSLTLFPFYHRLPPTLAFAHLLTFSHLLADRPYLSQVNRVVLFDVNGAARFAILLVSPCVTALPCACVLRVSTAQASVLLTSRSPRFGLS